MPIYAFRARDAKGFVKTGSLEADDEREALTQLQRMNFFVIELGLSRDIAHTLGGSEGWNAQLFKPKVKTRELAVLVRQLAVLYASGISILNALATVGLQTAQPELKKTLKATYARIREGESLGEAMRRFPHVFPSLLYNMVSAGEVSGSLDEVLDRAASHFQREAELEEKIKSALAYPKMVMMLLVAVGIFMLSFVVPRFIKLFMGLGVELPLPTRILIGMGDFMGTWWWLVCLSIVGIYAVIVWYGSKPEGRKRYDAWSLRYPVFGQLNRKKVVSRFCRTLATLSRSGVPIIPALALVRQTLGNAELEEQLAPIQEAIRRGEGIAPQLEKNDIFPPLVIQMVTVGEETGNLDVMLEKAADFLDDDIKTLTDRLSQMLEPYVIIVLGVVVTFIILSVVLPMFDSFGAIG